MRQFTNKWFHLSLLLTGLVFATVSCKKDEKTSDRDKFLATYAVAEDCSGQARTYDIIIEASAASDNAVTIDNFYNLGIGKLNATVSGDNITIPSQVLSSITFSGSGSISGNILTLDFTLANGPASVACTGVCTKK